MGDQKMQKTILWKIFLVTTLAVFASSMLFFIYSEVMQDAPVDQEIFQKEDNTAEYLARLGELGEPEIEPINREGTSGAIPSTIDVSLQRLEIPLSDADITVDAESITFFTSSMDVSVKLNDSIYLEGFSGMLKWSNGILSLEGDMESYKTSHTTVNWKKKSLLMITIDSGSVKTQNIAVERLESVATGSVVAGPNTLSLYKDILKIEQYSGSLDLFLYKNSSRAVMNGKILNLTAVTKNSVITIK